MKYKNMYLVILIILLLSIQGCAEYGKLKYFQAYYNKSLQESEIAWITIGPVIDEDNKIDYVGKIEVIFEEPTVSIAAAHSLEHGKQMDVDVWVYPNFRAFALPAGDHKFWVRYFQGTGSLANLKIWTEWRQLSKNFEGGKCYQIYDKQSSDEIHEFKVEEFKSCSWTLRRTTVLELYRLGGTTVVPKVELIKSYNITDEIFLPFKKTGKNGTYFVIPFESIRKLFEELG